eukprot:902012-Pelagomonas_calceolata.AAC.2
MGGPCGEAAQQPDILRLRTSGLGPKPWGWGPPLWLRPGWVQCATSLGDAKQLLLPSIQRPLPKQR